MKPETKYNIKAFLWDQIVRPIRIVFNANFMRLLFLAMIFISIIILKSTVMFVIFLISTLITYVYELIKYYKSGEYKANYRKYRYPDYKKAIKEMKKSKNQTHTELGKGEQQGELKSNEPLLFNPADSTQEVKDGEQEIKT